MNVEIKKKLITDNNKEFSVGQGISFSKYDDNTKYLCRYIGKILSINENEESPSEGYLQLTNVEINRSMKRGTMIVKFSDVEDCNYVYVDK